MNRNAHNLAGAGLAVAASLMLLTACSDAVSEDGSSGAPQPTAISTSPTVESSPQVALAVADVVSDPPPKAMQEALDAALNEFSGDVTKIELEPGLGGRLEYKIELISSDTEYEVQYDASTLEKLSEEREALGEDADQERQQAFDPDAVVSLEEAVNAARDYQAGAITEWKLEGKDNGLVQYEFDIQPGADADDVEVKVNAMDGSVIELS